VRRSSPATTAAPPTYQGVTDKEIKIVMFSCQPNEQVDALLATQGLAATEEEYQAMIDASVKFMNENYELYGRKIVWKRVIGDCTLTPPDPAKARQAAAEVAREEKPFLVHHYASGPSTHDVWSQAGILSTGGPTQVVQNYSGRRPFRWDIFTDGNQTAEQIGEYVCKKLAKKPASHAGTVIHPSIGNRTTTRKFAVVTPDNGDGANLPTARQAASIIKGCSGTDTPLFTYASDINRAEEQTRVVVAGLIENKVTSVVCMCDAIAPAFLTNGLTRNNYFPEHVLPGANLMDYDLLGRLYDKQQWQHAFGPSQLANAIPHAQSDATKIWRAAGNSGQPCASCNLVTGYMLQMGLMFQQAGPNLNPLTVEQGLVGQRYSRGGWNETKGNGSITLQRYGPNDYTGLSDFREVYWSETAVSAIDGKPGAYIPMDNGRRFALGEVPSEFKVPAAPR
jgi:hypothetical protein